MTLLTFIQPNFMKYGYMYWVEYHQYNNHTIVLRELVDKKRNTVRQLTNTYRWRVLKQLRLGDNVADYIEDILMMHFFAHRSHILELHTRFNYLKNMYYCDLKGNRIIHNEGKCFFCFSCKNKILIYVDCKLPTYAATCRKCQKQWKIWFICV
jgi:hypothetical protein